MQPFKFILGSRFSFRFNFRLGFTLKSLWTISCNTSSFNTFQFDGRFRFLAATSYLQSMTSNLPTEICKLKSTIHYGITFGNQYEFESETQSGVKSETESGTQYKIEWLPRYKSADCSCCLQIAVQRMQFADCSLQIAVCILQFANY